MCEYCTNSINRTPIVNDYDLGLSIQAGMKPTALLWGKDAYARDINKEINFVYCPMCGHKLNEGSETHTTKSMNKWEGLSSITSNIGYIILGIVAFMVLLTIGGLL